jgi:hypothetical protein
MINFIIPISFRIFIISRFIRSQPSVLRYSILVLTFNASIVASYICLFLIDDFFYIVIDFFNPAISNQFSQNMSGMSVAEIKLKLANLGVKQN